MVGNVSEMIQEEYIAVGGGIGYHQDIMRESIQKRNMMNLRVQLDLEYIWK